ncbi:MAG: hypothetical protein C4329_15620 [Chitinophagaceae bacterium]
MEDNTVTYLWIAIISGALLLSPLALWPLYVEDKIRKYQDDPEKLEKWTKRSNDKWHKINEGINTVWACFMMCIFFPIVIPFVILGMFGELVEMISNYKERKKRKVKE